MCSAWRWGPAPALQPATKRASGPLGLPGTVGIAQQPPAFTSSNVERIGKALAGADGRHKIILQALGEK